MNSFRINMISIKPSEFLYSPNQFIGWDFFCCFLQKDDTNFSYIFRAFNLMTWCPLWHGPTYNKQIEKNDALLESIHSLEFSCLSSYLSVKAFRNEKYFCFSFLPVLCTFFHVRWKTWKNHGKVQCSSYPEFCTFCTFCYLYKYCWSQIRHQSIFLSLSLQAYLFIV